MRILVVDDDPFALKVLARQLETLGYSEVIQHQRAHDVLTALESAKESVDLIFCDLQMPEMDGVEFIRHLVRVRYTGALVLVSGEDERIMHAAERLAREQELDVLGAISKPTFPERLQDVLRTKLSGATGATVREGRKFYEADALRNAIDNDELVNYFQPKVEVATAAVIGVEALVRWRHPRDGLVYPDVFIALAEQHGLIDELTRWVLASAVLQARAWRDDGLDLHVAVNVSMDNLRALEFPDFVAAKAMQAGIPLNSVVLEVTENQALSDPVSTLDILTRLRLKRIGLAIDDFGTGHSSLAQLRDLPFDELKIDRGFVHGAGRDKRLRAIFDASLTMGRRLNMKIVAEGVEDRADWDFLRSTGCDVAQGYFIARPLPCDQIADWIQSWREGREALLGFVS